MRYFSSHAVRFIGLPIKGYNFVFAVGTRRTEKPLFSKRRVEMKLPKPNENGYITGEKASV